MFDNLTQKLHGIFKAIAGNAKLTEKNIDDSLRAIRTSLLEADVNYRVVMDFVKDIKEKAIGQKVLTSVTPSQMLIKIVYDELVNVLGKEKVGIRAEGEPAVIMMVGLHGSGKTTSCGKIAKHFKETGKKPLLAALDIQRPAAMEQLQILGNELGVEVYKDEKAKDVVKICKDAVNYAKKNSFNVVILDTSGRWHIEEDLIKELTEIKNRFEPQEILLVVDSTIGQDAVNIAKDFNEKLSLTGFVLTKVDGDSRGGAAVSIRAVTGRPIKFIGIGEHLGDIQEFYPDRIASRILGMGDIMTLVEKVEKAAKEEEKKKDEQLKKKKHDITLEDFLKSIRQIRKIAPLADMLKMLPMGGMFSGAGAKPDKELKRIEAMISSMTVEERKDPEIIDGSRRKRIAAGSGTTPQDVNILLHRFEKMKDTMKKMQKQAGLGGIPMPPGMGGLGGMGSIKMPKKPFPFPPRWK